MGVSAHLRRAPLRLTSGAFVLNSGVAKFGADDESSKKLQATAATMVPQVDRMDPRVFARVVAGAEVGLGAALLLPVVPPAAAGLGLTLFAGSALSAWLHAPGAKPEGSMRPTTESLPIAKDAWMLGSGVSLLVDALTAPAHDKHVQVSATVHEKAAERKRRWRRAQRKAAAEERLHDMGERIGELRDEYQPVAAKKLKKARKKVRKQSKQLAESARASAKDTAERIHQAVSEAA